MIVVYTSNQCASCDAVKKYLKIKGADYEERNVIDTESYMKEMIALTGTMITPVTTDGTTVATGTDYSTLSTMV